MAVSSRLGLEDTMPFGQFKGKKIEQVYKINAGYLMWLRDAKADPKPDANTGQKQPPNRQFFDLEVLLLLNSTISSDPSRYPKHQVWPDVGTVSPEPDDTPFPPPALAPEDIYQSWGAF